MPESPSTKAKAEIPRSAIEYTVRFVNPLIGGQDSSAHVIAAVLNSLKPFGFDATGVEIKQLFSDERRHRLLFSTLQLTGCGLTQKT
jgi:hypothetical protein